MPDTGASWCEAHEYVDTECRVLGCRLSGGAHACVLLKGGRRWKIVGTGKRGKTSPMRYKSWAVLGRGVGETVETGKGTLLVTTNTHRHRSAIEMQQADRLKEARATETPKGRWCGAGQGE